MRSRENIDQAKAILNELSHQLGAQEITLSQALNCLDSAFSVVKKMDQEYFSKKLNVVQVKSLNGSIKEEPFTIED